MYMMFQSLIYAFISFLAAIQLQSYEIVFLLQMKLKSKLSKKLSFVLEQAFNMILYLCI